MADQEYDVVLVGGNHHNGLGLARIFGRHKIHPYGIVVANNIRKSFVQKSKYWKETWLVSDEQEALEIIKSLSNIDHNKKLLITWSDAAAKMVDSNLEELSKFYIVPSINHIQNAIVKLMDKSSQITFSEHFNLHMLPSYVHMIDSQDVENQEYPIIMKPVTSVEGSKGDMSICRNEEEYGLALEILQKKGFKRILVQKYLAQRKEYVVTGAVTDKRYVFSVSRSIRQWPMNFGTGSYSETVVDDKINHFCSSVLKSIKELGYRGPIDFEFFQTQTGELYVNEINWRSSGRNFIEKYTGVESAYIYYCDIVGIDYKSKEINEKHGYSMNDATDFKHVVKGDISIFHWIKDMFKTNSFSVWDITDLKPVIYRYKELAYNLIQRRKAF